MNARIEQTDALMASLGVEAWRVGGSVRDEILGIPAKDADYMVRGVSLHALKNVLRSNKLGFGPLADRHGRELGVRLAKGGVEITLPRKEISTGPGHRDFDIVLDPMLGIGEDALRRDFTFNALYKHLDSGEIGDPTGCGLYDLQHRFIRTTHVQSFRDDPLRILRALRFTSTLGYDLAADTALQMTAHADAVTGLTDKGVSGTVYDEFCKLLMGQAPHKALALAASTGVLATVFPELAAMIGFDQGSRYHDLTTDEHTFKALETAAKVDAPLRVRWALLFHDSGKPGSAWRGKDGRLHYYAKKDVVERFETDRANRWDEFVVDKEDHEVVSERLWRSAAVRLNVPKEVREDVALLVREHMVSCEKGIRFSKVARERIRLGDDMLRDLYLHRMCDLTGKGKANRGHLANIAAAEKLRQRMVEERVPKTVKDLEIKGGDVMKHEIAGASIGSVLGDVLDEVAVDPSPLKRSRGWQLSRVAKDIEAR